MLTKVEALTIVRLAARAAASPHGSVPDLLMRYLTHHVAMSDPKLQAVEDPRNVQWCEEQDEFTKVHAAAALEAMES